MGKLDEISQSIGALQATTGGLQHTFNQHLEDDDRRHSENISEIRRIADAMQRSADLQQQSNAKLNALIDRVNIMSPIVDGYQISRWKMAGAVGLASIILAGFGWILAIAVGEAAKWLLAHIR